MAAVFFSFFPSARIFLLVASASWVLALFLPGGSMAATSHTVGGESGWIIPSDSSFYESWAAKQTYVVGDSLVFKFPAGQHNVLRVASASCTSKPLAPALSTSPATVKLTEAGTHYYICGFPAHCDAGQILAVSVSGNATAAPAPSSAFAPAPAARGRSFSPASPSGPSMPAAPKSGSPQAGGPSSPGGSGSAPTTAPPKSDSPKAGGSLALGGLAAWFLVTCALVLA